MLYFVPTPIGNLEDITLRGTRILRESEVIICEDPRQTKKLLTLLGIQSQAKFVPFLKNHEFNFDHINEVLSRYKGNLNRGNLTESTIAVVSDAGSPGLSDPGFLLVQILNSLEIPFSVLPGSNSLIPAVVASGLVAKDFTFLGFLPIKKGRQKAWEKIKNSEIPIVIFESVHRIEKLLAEVANYLDEDRSISICREISKSHEQIWTGKVADLKNFKITLKGEFVVIFGENNG